jgi:hypothetical protein
MCGCTAHDPPHHALCRCAHRLHVQTGMDRAQGQAQVTFQGVPIVLDDGKPKTYLLPAHRYEELKALGLSVRLVKTKAKSKP